MGDLDTLHSTNVDEDGYIIVRRIGRLGFITFANGTFTTTADNPVIGTVPDEYLPLFSFDFCDTENQHRILFNKNTGNISTVTPHPSNEQLRGTFMYITKIKLEIATLI